MPFLSVLVVPLMLALVENPITTESLLRELSDPVAIARLPDPPFTMLQTSSYDRATVAASDPTTWFANNDAGNFLRVDERSGRKEFVMLDTNGPGAVVRIWSPNPKGVLRVYLDGATEPMLEGPMSAILDGTTLFGNAQRGFPLAAAQSRGWNFFVPITFAQHCRITTDDGAGVYFQVNWRAYGPAAPVRSTTPNDLSACAAKPAQYLVSVALDPLPAQADDWLDMPPQSSHDIGNEFSGVSSVVHSFSIDARSEHPREFMRGLQLEITCDGERTVQMPLWAFIGSDAVLDSADAVISDARHAVGHMRVKSAWPMPFQRAISVRLTNDSSVNGAVRLRMQAEPRPWDARSMRFHATWHRDAALHTRPMRDFRFADVTGQGVLAGDTLHIVNPVDAWWGEGDEKIYVDNETFPSHIGTGTEDYYGYGWCSPEPFAHPLHSQSLCDGHAFGTNWGRSIVTRLRGLDAIPFTKRLVFDMEVWHWAECDVSYSATSYWYARPGAVSGLAPDGAEAKRGWTPSPERPKPYVIEGALECEAMTVLAKSDATPIGAQDLRGFGAKTWSGDKQLWVQGRRAGDFVELAIPVTGSAPVRVSLHATKSWDYGVVRFSVNGTPVGEPIDLWSGAQGKVVATGPIDLGMQAPRAGVIVLRAEVVGGNAKSAGTKSFFGLDCVTLTPAAPTP